MGHLYVKCNGGEEMGMREREKEGDVKGESLLRIVYDLSLPPRSGRGRHDSFCFIAAAAGGGDQAFPPDLT